MKTKRKNLRQSRKGNVDVIVLDNHQKETLIDIINNPPEPNEDLKALFH